MPNEQADNKECPSLNRFGIQCPCIPKGVARQLYNAKGPTLLLLPPAILPQWLSEFKKHVDLKDTISQWTIRCAHTASARASNIPKPTKEDYQYLNPDRQFKDGLSSGFLCFTTTSSYTGQIEATLGDVRIDKSLVGKKQINPWKLAWARIIVDEAHKEVAMSTKGSLVANLYPNAAKWFVSGTPFERGPSQMQCWLSRISAHSWYKKKARESDYWPNVEERKRGWAAVQDNPLLALNKNHTKMVDGNINAFPKQERSAHTAELSLILKTWWIQRDAEKSRFFGRPLVILPPRTHENIKCRLPKRYQDRLNYQSMTVNSKVLKSLTHSFKEWERRPTGTEPAPKINRWLNEQRRLRIVTSFPALEDIEETKYLSFSASEDYAKEYVSRESGTLYRLNRENSPYERYIRRITNPKISGKIKALRSLMAAVWDSNERVVIVTMGPTVALILYWVRL